MKTSVTIIDYGVGNLLSVIRAFEYCGAEVTVTDRPEGIEQANKLILPGVGAFADGMAGLQERGLVKSIYQYAVSERPIMGICLGMQMMLETSEEFGIHEGLGLVQGQVLAIPAHDVAGNPHKIPHIGWNQISPTAKGQPWESTIMQEVEANSYTYFVHSYAAVPSNEEHRLANCYYNGVEICAAIQSGVMYGCQFHPEKSGEVGLKIIKRFLEI